MMFYFVRLNVDVILIVNFDGEVGPQMRFLVDSQVVRAFKGGVALGTLIRTLACVFPQVPG